ncbi:uncharacterized protein YydD (DUF2326 family) [Marinobacter sp. LV10R520-4]|uniref:DUF2326 domain-containing protein n=1 Tax=Marinobacter sp. LV10R520-4 TaxID=1761796 RepID=UPI000C01C7A4|nr:DUF2326 domain-containing protein [Marinobacter sp. LV10R520-4]PFG51976.1 uncharacterized protein YydD (DUF2326 family) [Marinobacter sp. LV10R520-4]
MILLKLSSTNPLFKTIVFNPGLNIIAGLQISSSNTKETYNGVGKSFTLILVHLLLGAKLDTNSSKGKKIKNFLAEYGEFRLDFKHNGISHYVEKKFSETAYHLNGKQLSQPKFREKLNHIFLPPHLKGKINFRQVFNIFARRHGGSFYASPLTQQGQDRHDYFQKFANLQLLGLDTDLVERKKKIKEDLSDLKNTQTILENQKEKYESKNIKDLEELVNKLTEDRNNFVIAENFDQLKRHGDELTNEANKFRNQIYKLDTSITRKLHNLELSKKININPRTVQSLYEEAKFHFNEKLYRNIEEVTNFHNNLLSNRRERLDQEIQSARNSIKTQDKYLKDVESRRDRILKDLDSRGALEEYNSINETINRLSKEIVELQKFSSMLKELRERETELDLENAKLKSDSLEYLDREEQRLEKIENQYRTLVKKFYDNHGGKLKINLTKDAKYLFDIDIDIPRDGSQGVSEVKIFCYDILLYELNKDLLGFIAHDGYIFSEMDPRQKSMIFKVILEKTKSGTLQYFVNIGQSSLEEVLDKNNQISILTDEEKHLMNRSIILELFDKNPKNWLFGTEFG